MSKLLLIALIFAATICIANCATTTGIPKGWQMTKACQNHCSIGGGSFKSQHLTCPSCCQRLKGGKVSFRTGECQLLKAGTKCLCKENPPVSKPVKGNGGKGGGH